MPLSILLLNRSTSSTLSFDPHSMPTRQPAILWLLLKEFNSITTSFAKDVVIELNSFSKSHNMAGWRVGMLCGSKERVEEVLRFKSNMDSGMFLPLQLAAARALELGQEWNDSVNAVYKKRRNKVFSILDLLQCSYNPDQAGLFVWAAIPGKYKDGYELSDE